MSMTPELMEALTVCQNPKCKKGTDDFGYVEYTPQDNRKIKFCSLSCFYEYIESQQ